MARISFISIISSSNKSFLKNTSYPFEVHWVMGDPKNISGTAKAMNMGEKQMIMISKFVKHVKK